jgi:U3 small nucleolar RNA-associated protein 21
MWIFDSADGNPRLLRSREGHRGTSNRIRFYGAVTTASMRDNADGMSCEILSAGADNTFRLFNFALESQNREITQKPMLKKLGIQRRNERLPPIIGTSFILSLDLFVP